MGYQAVAIMVLLVLAASVGARAAGTATIEVFHTTDDPVVIPQGAAVTAYPVDEAQNMRRKLTNVIVGHGGMSTEKIEQRARQVIDQVNQGNSGIMQGTIDSYQGLKRAHVLAITKVPAVVFDGKYIVYGVHSLKEAVQIYSSTWWRR